MARRWIPFNLDDWCGDHNLQGCPLDTQGFFLHLMHQMARSKPPGFLPENPLENPLETLKKLMSFSPQTIRKHVEKLQSFGVLKLHENGRWYNERMYNDWLKYEKSREYGARGGNPSLVGEGLTEGVNPRVKGGVNLEIEEEKNKEKEIYKEKENRVAPQWKTDFGIWWANYPHKQGRPRALAHYCSWRAEGKSAEELVRGRDRYIAAKHRARSDTYANGSTFLNPKPRGDSANIADFWDAATEAEPDTCGNCTHGGDEPAYCVELMEYVAPDSPSCDQHTRKEA